MGTERECASRQKELLRLLVDRNPYNRAQRFERVEAEFPRFEAECGPRVAGYVRIMLELARASISTDTAIERYMLLRDADVAPDFVALQAANEVARLTLRNRRYPRVLNEELRRKALELARRLGDRHAEPVLMSNWMSAFLEQGDEVGAEALERPIEVALGNFSPEEREAKTIIECRSRFASHRARLQLLRARHALPEQRQALISQARDFYTEAVLLVPDMDERRVNTQIEWAREWVTLYRDRLLADAVEAQDILEKAYRALDSHDCAFCKAFFQEVRSALLEVRADRQFNEDRPGAVALWREARTSLKASIDGYTTSGHHFAHDYDERLATLEDKLTMNTRHPRVFLSHKTLNKPLVWKFKEILDELGFDAWLDDDAMPAGSELDPSIIEGIETSCAAVFFVTPEFTDEGYIGKEIARAIDVKQRKGNDFAIIALRWGEDTSVPASLQAYVCKHVTSELDALHEILRALPVQVGSVFWRKAPIGT